MFSQIILANVAAFALLFPVFNYNFLPKTNYLEPAGVCQNQAFTGSRVSPTLAAASGTLTSDFNNDGRPDIVHLHGLSSTVSVQLNTGNGYFGTPQTISNISGFRITTGDFNNDGNSDIVTVSQILFGNGAGGFSAPQSITLIPGIARLGVGDFNGDDNLDVVGTDSFSGPVVVFYGDGIGNFASPVTPTLTGTPSDYKVSDFNQDGISDLVVVLSNLNTVTIALGNQAGTFETPVNYPLGGQGAVAIVAAGDLNGNGSADLIASSTGFGQSETFFVPLINAGNGVFTALPRIIEPTGGIRQIALFDIDSDGNQDYLATSPGSLIRRVGNGNGTFQNSTKSPGVSAETQFLFEDFTGDGIPDIGLGSFDLSIFTVFPIDANGNAGVTVFPVTGFTPIDIASADFNSDTRPDVVTANNSVELSLSFGDGTGGFSPPTSIPLSRTPRFILAADINADNNKDIVVLIQNNSDPTSRIAAYFGNGNGTFQTAVETPVTSIGAIRKPVLANMNGDQFLDLAVPGSGSSDQRVALFRGTDNGGFIPLSNIQAQSVVRAVTAGDLNQDSIVDLAVLTLSGVQVYLGNGNIGFSLLGTFPARSAASRIFSADLNDDQVLDLVVLTDFIAPAGNNGFAGILLGIGGGGFQAVREYPVGRGPGAVEAADFDGDGNLDLAVANLGYTSGVSYADNQISVLYGDGTGEFPRTKGFIGANRLQGLAIGDFNSDTNPDIVTADFNLDNFTLLTNICLPQPATGLPGLSIGSDTAITEGDASSQIVNIPVTLTQTSAISVRVQYYTAPPTGLSDLQGDQFFGAAGGIDYRPVRGTLVFAPGETTKNIAIPINGDLIDEFDEKLLVFLANATNAVLSDNKAEITILDNDEPPSLSIGNFSGVEGNTGNTNFNFLVTLSAASEKPVLFNYLTGGGTATVNNDYIRGQGLFTIAPRAIQAVVPVSVIGDLSVEPDETFQIEIRDPVNATIGINRGTGTIQNDDNGGVLTLSSSSYTTNENTSNFLITVNRMNGNGGGVSVRFRTQAGTATPGQDYREVNTIVNFAANETSKNVVIPILADQLDEGDETVDIILDNPVNATLGSPSTAVLTIQDVNNQPNLSISNASVIEGNSGTTIMSFNVNLSFPTKLDVLVDFATADDTATAGSDYVAASGTFMIPAGSIRRNMLITVNGDTQRESDETFFVNLSNPVNAVLTDNQAIGRIINDEVDPSFGLTRLVSVNFANTGSGNSDSLGQSISNDGKIVAFDSFANNLVNNDGNGVRDIFARDLDVAQVELVSINQSGTGSGNCISQRARISGNGRFVAFTSCASNLIAPDGQPVTHTSVFVRDLELNQTRLVSVGSNNQQVNGEVQDISADGRFIAFTSSDQNVTGIPDNLDFNDVFVRDMQQNITYLVSVNAAGNGAGNANSNHRNTIATDVKITADGRYVIYPSAATNLVGLPFIGSTNIFVRDLQTQMTIPVSVNSDNTALVGADFGASISDDGKYAYFSTIANGIVPIDTNNTQDVYRRNLQTNTPELVSVNQAGDNGGNGFSENPVTSADGRFVSFTSGANNLTPTPDSNQSLDVFWRDMNLGTARIVSIDNNNSIAGNAFSRVHDISADGQNVLFVSAASNLVSPTIDINQNFDLFLRDLRIGRTNVASVNEAGTSVGKHPTTTGVLSADGRSVAFETYSSNLVPNDTNGASDVFVFIKGFSRTNNFDYDGDGKTDISIFRPANGQWWVQNSSTMMTIVSNFGESSDVLVPADYTGDGKADIAFFRPSSGEWFILRSEDSSFYSFPFGGINDIPAPGDFDGDGRYDPAVFRPSTATWFMLQSSGPVRIEQFGAAGDRPVSADYDGDGLADKAIFRPADGQWWINRSTDNGTIVLNFGTGTDRTVQGDYTGDGKTDVAFWRSSTGDWFILRSEDFSFYSFPFGNGTDLPVPGDYDGDRKVDAAVFRPSNVTWFINGSTAGQIIQSFGAPGDIPTPNAYVR